MQLKAGIRHAAAEFDACPPLGRGLAAIRSRLNNGGMKQNPHVFTWDNEPNTERPSIFESSTYAPTESWFDALPEDRVKAPRRATRTPRHSLTQVLMSFALLLSVCGFALYELSVFLRG